MLVSYKGSYIQRKTGTAMKRKAAEKITKWRQAAKPPAKTAWANPGIGGTVTVPVRPPPPGEGKRGEKGHLAYLLRQAQAATRLQMERSLADLGVTPPQFAVLTMLNAYPGLSGADVARVALLTPQTVGVIIRNLERNGAIRKSPHPVHGRVLRWTLTRRGLVLLEKCRRHALALERRLGAGLNRKTEAAVRGWLSNIAL